MDSTKFGKIGIEFLQDLDCKIREHLIYEVPKKSKVRQFLDGQRVVI